MKSYEGCGEHTLYLNDKEIANLKQLLEKFPDDEFAVSLLETIKEGEL
jgi:hypothetical protein